MGKKWLAVVVTVALLATSLLASWSLQGASIVYGDVNRDGDVDMKDVLALRKYVAGHGGDIDKAAADANGDGSIDMKDVLLMRKYIANLIPDLNGGQTEPTSSTATSVQPTTEPSGSVPTTTSTSVESIPETSAPTATGVIYDADVTGTLTLSPGATYANAAITSALEAYTAAHGVAERYIVTVTASASPEDYIYPILLGASAEVWPDNSYDHSYKIGQNGTTYGSMLGSKFTEKGDAPTTLYFYAEGGNATVTLKHVRIEAAGSSATPTTKSTSSTTKTTSSTTKTTSSTSKTTTKTTTRTTTPPTSDTVIYDADVTGTLTLAPGKTFESAAITAALQAETAAHGVAERYIVTVTASATPEDYIYPILIGGNGTEVWPNNNYDHSYKIGQNGTTYGSLLGSSFMNAGDAPTTLYFYADGENATLTLRHIKIEVVRGSGSSPTTSSSTRSTTRTTAGTTVAPPGDDGHPHLNYNTSTTYGSLGVWWWYNNTATNTSSRDERLNFLQSNHVTEIYLWADGMTNAQIATFIRAAASHGMRVAWLSGDVTWIDSGSSGFDNFYNKYNAYQAQAASDAKFYAMHLDVEPHQRGNTQENWQKYADLFVRACTKAHNAGHTIEWDIPYWLEGKKVTSSGSSVTLLNLLAQNADTLCLMSYRDTAKGILSASEQEIPLGTTYNCKIVLGVETYSEEGDQVSFMEEGKAAMYSALQSVLTTLSQKTTLGAGYGCAIHQIEVWYNLKD